MNETPNPASTTVSGPSADLQKQIDGLRNLFAGALVVLLIIVAAVNLAFRKQMKTVREEVVALRANYRQAAEPWDKEKPQLKAFLAKLQDFAKSNPDFASIFSKYQPALAQAELLGGSVADAIPTTPAGQ